MIDSGLSSESVVTGIILFQFPEIITVLGLQVTWKGLNEAYRHGVSVVSFVYKPISQLPL